MRSVASLCIIAALLSLVVGIISRLMFVPFMGLEANAFLRFSDTCLLFAIALTLAQTVKGK